MNVVESDGSLPASDEPRRIESAGAASSSMTTVAERARTTGRFCRMSAHRAQAGDSSLVVSSPAATARRCLPVSTRLPKSARNAGSSVSAASTVKATTIDAAVATP